MSDILALLGRIAFALIFIMAGGAKVANFQQYLGMMGKSGLPYPQIMLIISIILELGGGLMVLLGWRARYGALFLFLFTVPVTIIFHSFWNVEAHLVTNQMQHFLKNLTIMGGSLYIMAYGAGRYSIDRK